jgi:hypothetical protein
MGRVARIRRPVVPASVHPSTEINAMPRISIAAFRHRLAGRAQAGPLLEAYRTLTRRADAARHARMAGWGDWSVPPGNRP